MNQKIFKLSKLKIYISLFLLLISSFLTLFFSNKAEFNMEGDVMNATYLHIENYALMLMTVLIIAYYLISQIYMFLKEKNKYYLLMSITNVLLLLVLSSYVIGQTTYKDSIGLHIDKFIGLLCLFFSIINLIILSLVFLIIYLVKNNKKLGVK